MVRITLFIAILATTALGQTTRPTTAPADFASPQKLLAGIPMNLFPPAGNTLDDLYRDRLDAWTEKNLPGKSLVIECVFVETRKAGGSYSPILVVNYFQFNNRKYGIDLNALFGGDEVAQLLKLHKNDRIMLRGQIKNIKFSGPHYMESDGATAMTVDLERCSVVTVDRH